MNDRPDVALSRLATAMVDLSALRERDQMLHRLVSAVAEIAEPAVLQVLRPDAECDELRVVMRQPGAGPLTEITATPAQQQQARQLAIRCERPVPANDPATLVVYPLMGTLGAEELIELQFARPLSPARHLMLEQLLRLCSNLRKLLDYSECDELTGLLNRKTFDESFMKIGVVPMSDGPAAQADPDDKAPVDPFSDRRGAARDDSHWLAVVDIDHFKSVNDRFGHLVGDEVLLLLSQVMRDTFRHQDRLYRFGGEEFVVLLRCPQSSGAHSAFERLRARIASHEFPQVEHITVSIGYTCIDPDDTPESAFGRADKAVYHAKENGRNQVRHHADLIAAGLIEPSARPGAVDFF